MSEEPVASFVPAAATGAAPSILYTAGHRRPGLVWCGGTTKPNQAGAQGAGHPREDYWVLNDDSGGGGAGRPPAFSHSFLPVLFYNGLKHQGNNASL